MEVERARVRGARREASWRALAGCAAGAAVLAALAAWLAPPLAAAGGRRPNLILFLADDLGLSRVSAYGADTSQTPHIDRLAATGVRFERAYSMPLCGPSRAACLTGRYPFHNRQVDNTPAVRLDREVPLPRLLRAAGYVTCAIGKWGQLGQLQNAEDARRWGFDEYMLWIGSGAGAEEGADRYWNPRYQADGEWVKAKPGAYGPDLTRDYLTAFLSRHRDQPFFVYYATPLTHWPFLGTPDSQPGAAQPQLVRDNVAYLDKLVGQLTDELERLGLRDNTVIVFTSDNGPDGDPLGTIRGRRMAGRKASLKEGGCREPLIVSGPGFVKSGVVASDLADLTDVYPTLAELAGAALPPEPILDGVSFAPQLRGEPGRPREWVYAQTGDSYFIADQRYKLYGDGLFVDISDSPFAERPVPDGDAEGRAARARLGAALSRLRADAPSTTPPLVASPAPGR